MAFKIPVPAGWPSKDTAVLTEGTNNNHIEVLWLQMKVMLIPKNANRVLLQEKAIL
jgi:hypothetical protein